MSDVNDLRMEKTGEAAPDRAAWYCITARVDGVKYAADMLVTDELKEDGDMCRAVIESYMRRNAKRHIEAKA